MQYTTIRPEAAQEPPKQPRKAQEAQPRSYIRTSAAAPRRYTTATQAAAPRRYIRVSPAAAQRGDVIIFEAPEYDERITRGSWQKRFYMVREYMTITEQPSNNETVKAKDKRGRKRCRHLSDPGIIEIRRPA